jgi:hypothetical protein
MHPFNLLVLVNIVYAYRMMNGKIFARRLPPGVKRLAVIMATASLTARLFRNRMTIHLAGSAWTDLPHMQALVTAEMFTILADMGAMRLVVIGMIAIMWDVAWIIVNWEILERASV